MFTIKLHGRTEGERAQFYSNTNHIVSAFRGRGCWVSFEDAVKAAKRARLQDTSNRRVTVEDY